MKILYPFNPLNPKVIDPDFALEMNAAEMHMIDHGMYDHGGLVKGDPPKTRWRTAFTGTEKIVMRGWMMDDKKYAKLYNDVPNGKLVNTPEQFANAHYFPYAYSLSKTLRSITPRTWWGTEFDVPYTEYKKMSDGVNWDMVRKSFGNSDLILKDYVKSAKDKPELHFLSKDLTQEEFNERIQLFIEDRGKLFSKAIVLKEAVRLKVYPDGKTNEWRVFIYKGKLLDAALNVEDVTLKGRTFPTIFNDAIQIAAEVGSNMMTVDFAEKEDGTWIALECGDGQVSGLSPHSNVLGFYNRLKELENES